MPVCQCGGSVGRASLGLVSGGGEFVDLVEKKGQGNVAGSLYVVVHTTKQISRV